MVVNDKMQLYSEILRDVESIKIPMTSGRDALEAMNCIIQRLEEVPEFAQVLDAEPDMVDPFIHVYADKQVIGVSYVTNAQDVYASMVGSASLHPLPGRGTCCDQLLREFLHLEERKRTVVLRYMMVDWSFCRLFGWVPIRNREGLYELNE